MSYLFKLTLWALVYSPQQDYSYSIRGCCIRVHDIDRKKDHLFFFILRLFSATQAIPGVIEYKGARIQLLDLPGIVEGASQGRGRGRQVVSSTLSVDPHSTTQNFPQRQKLPT